MKNFLFGILFVLIFQTTLHTLELKLLDQDEASKHITNAQHILRGDVVAFTLTKRCTLDLMRKDITRRQYFGCNQVQIYVSDLFFGEYEK